MPRSVLTVRTDSALVAALKHLSKAVGRPVNQLVVEAIRAYVDRRTREVERDLEEQIRLLRACREADPDFEAAIAEFVDAEAVADDPVEGTVVEEAGPAQRDVRHILNG